MHLSRFVKRCNEMDGSIEQMPLDEWGLAALAIGECSERGARNAQRFRNLIHPGRAQRLEAECHRGTALAALAAVHLVAVDLEP